jgi:hypothetical protein
VIGRHRDHAELAGQGADALGVGQGRALELEPAVELALVAQLVGGAGELVAQRDELVAGRDPVQRQAR